MPASGPILVVDDDPAVLDVVTLVLGDEGYTVITARNGQEALDRLRQETPALILLDRMMPIMDGREFIRRWRERQEPRVPIVVLTADHKAIEWARTSGTVACLPKPFKLDDLLDQVSRNLDRERAN